MFGRRLFGRKPWDRMCIFCWVCWRIFGSCHICSKFCLQKLGLHRASVFVVFYLAGLGQFLYLFSTVIFACFLPFRLRHPIQCFQWCFLCELQQLFCRRSDSTTNPTNPQIATDSFSVFASFSFLIFRVLAVCQHSRTVCLMSRTLISCVYRSTSIDSRHQRSLISFAWVMRPPCGSPCHLVLTWRHGCGQFAGWVWVGPVEKMMVLLSLKTYFGLIEIPSWILTHCGNRNWRWHLIWKPCLFLILLRKFCLTPSSFLVFFSAQAHNLLGCTCPSLQYFWAQYQGVLRCRFRFVWQTFANFWLWGLSLSEILWFRVLAMSCRCWILGQSFGCNANRLFLWILHFCQY